MAVHFTGSAKEHRSRKGSGVRVLLVDDHDDSLEVTARLLRLEGYDVLTAATRKDAIAHAQRLRVDLLVTDLGLPDGTGVDLLEEIRKLYPVPAVAMTAHGESWFLDAARSSAFARHLFKPFVFSDLLCAVRGAAGAPVSQP